MQRLVAGSLRPAALAVATGAATHHGAARAPAGLGGASLEARTGSPTKSAISVDEGEYVNVFHEPCSRQEVNDALDNLIGLGHDRATTQLALARPGGSSAAAAPRGVAAGPVITEVEDADSVTSDGSEVNRSFYRADHVAPVFSDDEGELGFGGEPNPTVDLLGGVVHSLLSNPRVVSTIQAELVQDPHFLALIQHANPGLPASALLLLEEQPRAPSPAAAARHRRLGSHRVDDGGDPLVALLMGLQQGVAAAARQLGLGFIRLGSLLRGLAAEIGDALKGMRRQQTGAGPAEQAEAVIAWEKAVVKVACAVAVMVFFRRLAPITLA